MVNACGADKLSAPQGDAETLSPSRGTLHTQALAYKAALDAGFNVIAPWENRNSPNATTEEHECVFTETERSPTDSRRASGSERSLRVSKSFRSSREQHLSTSRNQSEAVEEDQDKSPRNDEDVDPEALSRTRKRSAFRWPKLQRKSQVGPPPNIDNSAKSTPFQSTKNASSGKRALLESFLTQFNYFNASVQFCS